jgi:tetratricopeptide (TPR) repeat protein
MAGKTFINYRREDSIATAGRLRDHLARTFGSDNLFMDVDNIPLGVDFVKYLISQVEACDVFLALIGPNWLNAKDKNGGRRIENADDFVAIEIAAALERNILVIPVLIDGTRMPTEGELPEALRPLARRQAFELRHAQFGRDAQALIEKLNEGFNEREVKDDADAEAKRRAEEAERQRPVATAQDAALARDSLNSAVEHGLKGNYDRAIADCSEAIELDPKLAAAYSERGKAYAAKGNTQRAIADYNEAIKLDPEHAAAYRNRGRVHFAEGDNDRAIADYTEAIKLDPNDAETYFARGMTYGIKGDNDHAIADYSEAIKLDPKDEMAYSQRGMAYAAKGNTHRAIADLSEAIRQNPNYTSALTHRGLLYENIGEFQRARADFAAVLAIPQAEDDNGWAQRVARDKLHR